MRLGLLGPQDDEPRLVKAAELLLQDVAVHRAVYLGVDGALDKAVRKWAARLVGERPGDTDIWNRAVERCLDATPEEIDEYLSSEHERRALKVLESLPGDGSRAIELLNGKVAVMIHDKAGLDEDDIVSATLLIFGKSPEPVIKQVGSRWFLSPGQGGIMLLEDHADGIHMTLFDADGGEQRRERLVASRSPKLRVSAQED